MAVFTFELTHEGSKTLIFTNTSTDAESYSWAFGDVLTSTDASPSHTYVQGGDYSVVLTAVGEVGSTPSEKTVTVNIPIPMNYVKGGAFESSDASFWTVIPSGQKDADGTLTNVKYAFGHTAYKPALGTGGSLFIYPTNTDVANPFEEGTIFYQKLEDLEAGTYQISSLVKLAGEDSSANSTAMKNYWFEFVIDTQVPEEGNGYNLDRTTGWYYGGWTGWQVIVPALDGFLPHNILDTNKADADGNFTLAAGTYYLVIKVGKGGSSTLGEGIALDNLTINKIE
jgi:PKD repeat protein